MNLVTTVQKGSTFSPTFESGLEGSFVPYEIVKVLNVIEVPFLFTKLFHFTSKGNKLWILFTDTPNLKMRCEESVRIPGI